MKRISIFGLGYVGSVSAASLAAAGHQVIGVDTNPDKVRMVNEGSSPIVEPGLGDLIARVVGEGRLRATTSCAEAVRETDLAFICVGTPGDGHGQLELDALRKVSREIGATLRGSTRNFTVVVRSTVLPGTTENVVRVCLLEGAGEEYAPLLRLAVNPEFIREGSALQDFRHPPFTLVGSEDLASAAQVHSLYAHIEAPFEHTPIKTAEAVKYASNSFHALKVCFANEMGDVLTALGVDAQDVMRVFCMDRKLNLSEAYLRPGFAFGGSCLPKDLKALLYAARHRDLPLPLLNAILPSNEEQVRRGIEEVLAVGSKRVGVLGLSFKSNTDDLRESPLVRVVEHLIGKGCEVRILDRNVSIARLTGANRRYIEEGIPHIAMLMCETPAALLEHAQVLVIGSDSPEARRVLAGAGPEHTIIDLTRHVCREKNRSREAA